MQIRSLVTQWQFWVVVFISLVILILAGVSVSTFMGAQAQNRAATETAWAFETAIAAKVPLIQIAPALGSAGTTIEVIGEEWTPGDDVTVQLETLIGAGRSMEVAALFVQSDGRFVTSFKFPNDPDWLNHSRVLVKVTDSRNRSAVAEFGVVAPTATNTLVAVTNTPAGVTNVPARTTGDLNLRLGPSSVYPVLRVVAKDTNITVIGQNQDGAWLFVRLNDGTEGWLPRPFTNFQPVAIVLVDPPIPAPTSTTLPAPVPITDWRGEYWSNPDLAGQSSLIRNDVDVNFNWGPGSPDTSIPVNGFSARWTRTLWFEEGVYRFHLAMDDGARAWVDGQIQLDAWADGGIREITTDLSLVTGDHTLTVTYYDRVGDATVRFWWERIPPTPTPTLTLTHTPTPSLTPTATSTLIPTATLVPTAIITTTPTLTATPTVMTTPTLTATATLTPTLAATATLTPTLAPTATLTPTIAATPTILPTATETPTLTPTVATTPTLTPTLAATATPTLTATAVVTATETPEPQPAPVDTPVPQSNLSVSPNSGPASTAVNASLAGFAANTNVGLYLSTTDHPLAEPATITGQTDASGNLVLSFNLPDQWPDGSPINPGPITVSIVGPDNTVHSTTVITLTP